MEGTSNRKQRLLITLEGNAGTWERPSYYCLPRARSFQFIARKIKTEEGTEQLQQLEL
jgi:hypothetical protein